jgi:hypothetical protein
MRAVGTQIHQPDAGDPRRGTFFVESGKNKPYRTRAELVNRYRSAMSQANELTKLVHRELGRSDVHCGPRKFCPNASDGHPLAGSLSLGQTPPVEERHQQQTQELQQRQAREQQDLQERQQHEASQTAPPREKHH